MKTYGPSEFIQKLSANELPAIATPTIAGLVKHDPAKPDIIEFSSTMSCERWLAIPTDMIEDITHLQYVRCKDHQHPLVKIKLKQPDKARVDLAFLLGLVSELQGIVERLASSPKTSAEARDGACYYKYVDPPGVVFVCCGDEPICTGVAAI
jgi:hypothetical protein